MATKKKPIVEGKEKYASKAAMKRHEKGESKKEMMREGEYKVKKKARK